MDIIDNIIQSIHDMEKDPITTMELIDEVEILDYKKHNSGGISDVYQKPWSKLNHNQKINRLNLFCNKIITENRLSCKEASDLKSSIMEGCIANPDIVEYDSVNAVIVKIRGLEGVKLNISAEVANQGNSQGRSVYLSDFTMIPLSLEKLNITPKKRPVVKRKPNAF